MSRVKRQDQHLFRMYNLTGGMDQSTNPFLLGDTKFTYLKNVNQDEKGTLSKDGGYSAYLSDTAHNTDDLVFDYVNWAGVHTPIKVSGGNMYKADIPEDEWSLISADVSSSGQKVSAANYNNKMFFVDPNTNIQYYDGTSVDNIKAHNGGADIRGKYLTTLGDILFLGNITHTFNANDVVYTNPADSGSERFYNELEEEKDTYATTSQRFTVRGEITGMRGFQGLLVVFTEELMWIWNPETLEEPKAIAETGCVSHDTIREIDGILYWAGREGVYAFKGSGMPHLISLPLTNWTVNSIWRLIDGANWRNLNAGVLDGRYYLWVGDLTAALPGDSAALEDVVIVYDTYRGTWSFYDNYPARQWARIINYGGNSRLLIANNAGSQTMMKDYSYTHNTAAIESVIRTKYFDYDSPEMEKVLEDFFVSYRPENQTGKYLQVGLAINGSNDYVTILNNTSSTRLPLSGALSKEFQHERVSLNGKRGRTISYEFKNADAGVNVTLLGYTQAFKYNLTNMNYTN